MGEVFRLAYAQQRLHTVSNNPVLFHQFGKHIPVCQVQKAPITVTCSVSANQDNSVSTKSSRLVFWIYSSLYFCRILLPVYIIK